MTDGLDGHDATLDPLYGRFYQRNPLSLKRLAGGAKGLLGGLWKESKRLEACGSYALKAAGVVAAVSAVTAGAAALYGGTAAVATTLERSVLSSRPVGASPGRMLPALSASFHLAA